MGAEKILGVVQPTLAAGLFVLEPEEELCGSWRRVKNFQSCVFRSGPQAHYSLPCSFPTVFSLEQSLPFQAHLRSHLSSFVEVARWALLQPMQVCNWKAQWMEVREGEERGGTPGSGTRAHRQERKMAAHFSSVQSSLLFPAAIASHGLRRHAGIHTHTECQLTVQ